MAGHSGDHRGVSDLLWDEVKQWFDPVENGSAPDVIVADTTLADWQLLLDLIRSHGWSCEYEIGDRAAPVPGSATTLFPAETMEQVPLLRVEDADAAFDECLKLSAQKRTSSVTRTLNQFPGPAGARFSVASCRVRCEARPLDQYSRLSPPSNRIPASQPINL